MVNVAIHRSQKECTAPLGAGFLYDSEIAITAAHCVKDVTELAPGSPGSMRTGKVRVLISTESEHEIWLMADVISDEDADIAVLKFSKKPFTLDELVVGKSNNVKRGAAWIVQPILSSMATLEGRVADPHKKYEMHSGLEIDVIQLTCNVNLSTHEGYSGGALQLENGHSPWPIAGMMIEQYPDPGPEDKSANILFALSIVTIARSSVFKKVSLKGVGVCSTQKDTHDERACTMEVARKRALEIERMKEEIIEERSAFLDRLYKKWPGTPAEFAMAHLMQDIDLDFEGAIQ